MWRMDGTATLSETWVATVPDAGYHIVAPQWNLDRRHGIATDVEPRWVCGAPAPDA
jgi:hypothetical protein